MVDFLIKRSVAQRYKISFFNLFYCIDNEKREITVMPRVVTFVQKEEGNPMHILRNNYFFNTGPS